MMVIYNWPSFMYLDKPADGMAGSKHVAAV